MAPGYLFNGFNSYHTRGSVSDYHLSEVTTALKREFFDLTILPLSIKEAGSHVNFK